METIGSARLLPVHLKEHLHDATLMGSELVGDSLQWIMRMPDDGKEGTLRLQLSCDGTLKRVAGCVLEGGFFCDTLLHTHYGQVAHLRRRVSTPRSPKPMLVPYGIVVMVEDVMRVMTFEKGTFAAILFNPGGTASLMRNNAPGAPTKASVFAQLNTTPVIHALPVKYMWRAWWTNDTVLCVKADDHAIAFKCCNKLVKLCETPATVDERVQLLARARFRFITLAHLPVCDPPLSERRIIPLNPTLGHTAEIGTDDTHWVVSLYRENGKEIEVVNRMAIAKRDELHTLDKTAVYQLPSGRWALFYILKAKGLAMTCALHVFDAAFETALYAFKRTFSYPHPSNAPFVSSAQMSGSKIGVRVHYPYNGVDTPLQFWVVNCEKHA